MSKKKMVVLGAGYAGLRTIKGLQKKNMDLDITLINKNSYHYEATQLHEVAAGTNPGEKISFEVKDVIDANKVNFIQDEVTKINHEANEVSLKSGKTVSYDYLVVALGFESESFGIKGVDEFGWPLVDIKTAEAAKEQLDKNLKNYQLSKDPKDLSVVVCGAGFTSIEYLGEITNRLPKLADKFNFPANEVKITCIEAMPKLLPMFSENLADYGVDVLKKRGVDFIVGTPIKEIKESSVVYEQEGELKEIEASTIVWTTGVRGSSVIGESGFEERRGRVMVESDLTVPGQPNVFMIGDVSAVMDEESGRPYPTTAQIAMAQADHVVDTMERKLAGQEPTAFKYNSLGTVASLGNNDAIGHTMNKDFKGYIASVMKKGIADKSLLQVGTPSVLLKKGRFDFYH
ncbi:NAD(P)/FAD-dependent oxidoreductase [Vagococcus intermedius]|uniref:NAD(P)/FAD-dependent oxidoreductase n=1 Tax=Vagococcus intermedius TaxID=2991418 RepID=A0AAF0CVQ9_9ENTE|nr:NAD(P)/FAD-dependent oxidoreductase [Vagococcus intermedius]WEG73763.1 NAD(P)/FAD-dependent oxidoreductase [Vagococcus intermedius]WEG75848.1 NAD(P)/FAD-dependent oxidoreductase [Vagococcus intermedius]